MQQVSRKILNRITLTLDRERELRFSVDAFLRWEKAMGRAFDKAATLDDAALLLVELARDEDPSVTFEMIRPFVSLETVLAMAGLFKQLRAMPRDDAFRLFQAFGLGHGAN